MSDREASSSCQFIQNGNNHDQSSVWYHRWYCDKHCKMGTHQTMVTALGMVLNWFDEMRKHIFHFMGRRWQHQISRWMVVTTRQHQVMANSSSSSSSISSSQHQVHQTTTAGQDENVVDAGGGHLGDHPSHHHSVSVSALSGLKISW